MARQRVAEVVERTLSRRDLSYIPDELCDQFPGMCLSLANGHPNMVAQYSTEFRFPLVSEDVPETVRKELETLLVQHGFVKLPTGYYQKGDCIIFKQAADARAEMLERGLTTWALQDSPDMAEDRAAELQQKLPKGLAGESVRVTHWPGMPQVHR